MKRDHYIIPICSPSTPILDAICYLTQLTKFVLVCLLHPTKKIKPERCTHRSSRSRFSLGVIADWNPKVLSGFNDTHAAAQFSAAQNIHVGTELLM